MSNYTHLSDLELTDLFKNGDDGSYQAIYNRYWQLLFRFARKLLQDDALAKDVVQEVFTILWTKRKTFEHKGPIAAYLYTLTRHKILDLVKHAKVEDKYLVHLQQVMQSKAPLPDQLYIEKELYDQIEREIQNLPEKMRVIFEMSRKEYKSTSEIADELGLSQQTVKNQVSNAIRTLKDKFGDQLNIFLIIF